VISGETGRRNGKLNEGTILNLILNERTNCWILSAGSKPALSTNSIHYVLIYNVLKKTLKNLLFLFGGTKYRLYICTQ